MPATPRVLIVEDEMLVAMSIEDALSAGGFAIAGIAGRVDDALARLDGGEDIDAAVMDLNLAGKATGAVADRLTAMGIPFVVVTGYGGAGLPAQHREVEVITKPFEPASLVATLKSILARGT